MQRTDIATGFGNGIAFVRFSFVPSDLTTAGLTQTIQLLEAPGGNAFQTAGTSVATLNSQNFQIPQGGAVLYVRVRQSTAFAAPAATSLTVSLGKTGGSATAITSASGNLVSAVADTTLQETFAIAAGQHSAYGVTANFTSIAGNLNTFTAGQVDIYIYYLNPTTASQSFSPVAMTTAGV